MRPEGEPQCLAGRALPLWERRNQNYAEYKAILPHILGAQSTQQLSEPFSSRLRRLLHQQTLTMYHLH